MSPHRYGALAAMLALGGCAVDPQPSADFPQGDWPLYAHADWNDLQPDPYYRIGPGDVLELTVYSAPELSREMVRVGPDGRIRLPLIGPIMAAARTPEDLEAAVRSAYMTELRDPNIDLLVTSYTSQQIFVGGEVMDAGLIDLPGQIDPLQAIIMAGGITDRANRSEALILRRLPGGELRTAVVDLRAGLSDPNLADWGPLQRFDVVWVPRSAIANQNLFIQQYVRDALPIQFSLVYDLAGRNR